MTSQSPTSSVAGTSRRPVWPYVVAGTVGAVLLGVVSWLVLGAGSWVLVAVAAVVGGAIAAFIIASVWGADRLAAKTGAGDEDRRRQRMRSVAIALSLAVLVILFYAATIIRLGGNVFNRGL